MSILQEYTKGSSPPSIIIHARTMAEQFETCGNASESKQSFLFELSDDAVVD
jgi:hypothetical protein